MKGWNSSCGEEERQGEVEERGSRGEERREGEKTLESRSMSVLRMRLARQCSETEDACVRDHKCAHTNTYYEHYMHSITL